MPLTITKPAVGSSGWGPTMNTNLDNIKSAVDTNETNQTNHTSGEGTKHSASQISVEDPTAENLQDALDAIIDEIDQHEDLTSVGVKHKAVNITMTDGTNLQDKITAILALITVNTDNVVVSARVREIPGYLSIDCSISPAGVAPRFWRAVISKREGTGTTATIVELLSQDFYASRTNIPFDILPGVDVGNILYVKVYAFFSESDFAEANEQSLTYQGYESPIVERVRNIEENINIPAFVAAAKEDPALITLLANELQNSITLARKISEASAQ